MNLRLLVQSLSGLVSARPRTLIVGSGLTLTDNADSTATLTGSGGGAAVASDAIWTAKGDLVAGTGASAASRLAVGANGTVLKADSTQPNGMGWAVVSGSGTVTSVDLTMPGEFAVTGNPVTASGTLAVAKATQVANKVYAGPATGADAAPTFRTLVAADIPGGGGSAGVLDVTVGNTTGSTIVKGSVVKWSDNGSGGLPLVDPGNATYQPGTGNPFGILLADLPNGGSASCRCFGTVTGLDTHTFAVGDDVMAGAGGTLAAYPTVGQAWVGVVLTSNATTGSVFVGCGIGGLPYPPYHQHGNNGDGGQLRFPNFTEVGSSFTLPPAGTQTLFVDSADHKLKRCNSAGTITIIG